MIYTMNITNALTYHLKAVKNGKDIEQMDNYFYKKLCETYKDYDVAIQELQDYFDIEDEKYVTMTNKSRRNQNWESALNSRIELLIRLYDNFTKEVFSDHMTYLYSTECIRKKKKAVYIKNYLKTRKITDLLDELPFSN